MTIFGEAVREEVQRQAGREIAVDLQRLLLRQIAEAEAQAIGSEEEGKAE